MASCTSFQDEARRQDCPLVGQIPISSIVKDWIASILERGRIFSKWESPFPHSHLSGTNWSRECFGWEHCVRAAGLGWSPSGAHMEHPSMTPICWNLQEHTESVQRPSLWITQFVCQRTVAECLHHTDISPTSKFSGYKKDGPPRTCL